MAATEEPVLSRLDRLDNMLRQLEEIRWSNRSSRSSCGSNPSSGTLTSEGCPSSVDLSPECLEQHRRPISHAMMETELKGTLIERLSRVEDRLLKLEEALEAVKKREERREKTVHRKGLNHLLLCGGGGKG